LSNNNLIETILIGTGGGYGESIVLHLGNNDWIVVDSCINPQTNVSLPLEYLESRGVNVENDVKLIVCSHWHDDHIKGISQLLARCKNSIFSIAIANDRIKFLRFVGLDYNKLKNEETVCSTIEIDNCLSIILSRNSTVKRAVEDKTLLSKNNKDISYEVISLSPSDYILEEFCNEISTLITDYGTSNKKIIYQSPNDKSVAILIKINDQRILLGSDLEVCNDERKGWRCIIKNSQTIDLKSQVFKIPHHGSSTGYDKAIWDKIIDENTIAKLSPWNRGKKLPKREMLETILNHTENLYSTSIPNNSKGKPKKREKSIYKAIARFNPTLKEVQYEKGIVRCVFNLENRIWEVETTDGGDKITENVLQFF
jgi:beta-lactamase superfamily II metal-dependent hydrolase